MKINFFDEVKYSELYDKYSIMGDKPKTIEEGKNIYDYGATLYAFIWNGETYVEYLSDSGGVLECRKYSKIELAYNIGKWYDDIYLFTDKGD
jgi:hypothetical protein